jgi:hypothetical protein
MLLNGKRVTLDRLASELIAAGVSIRGLGQDGDELHTYNTSGVSIDVPPGAAPVVAAHVADSTILYAGSFKLAGRVRTTDATVTEIFRATLKTNTEYAGQATVVGIDADDSTSKIVLASIAAKRLGAGALSIGNPVRLNPGQEDAAASAWAVLAPVSGNDWTVTVQGAAGRTIDWHLFGEVVSFAPSGIV